MNTSNIMSAILLVVARDADNPAGRLLDHRVQALAHHLLKRHPLADDRSADRRRRGD
jgi:hypothetical protein